MKLTDYFSTRKIKTPQREAAYGAVENSAGGFSFALDEWGKLDRFLILGTEGGTYYVSERALTRENAKNVERCIKLNGERVIGRVIEISASGRAPKNDSAIFVLAMCAGLGDEGTRKFAMESLGKVARVGTHLFMFAEYVQAFRGWGRSLKRGIGQWYSEKSPESLIYQAIKYQQRGGWTHRDLLRLCHPVSVSKEHDAIYSWICSTCDSERKSAAIEAFSVLEAVEKIRTGVGVNEVGRLILEHRLPREVVPTELLNERKIWEALLVDMPITALIRNLGKMTNIGLLEDLSDGENMVLEKLNKDALKRGRVHPLTILTALMTYQRGGGVRGSLTWNPSARVVEALEEAFYKCFENVVPTGKRIMVAVDVSGSMSFEGIAGSPMSSRDASAALAMIIRATEKHSVIKAFSEEFIDLSISRKMSLREVIAEMSRQDFGRTDCALPMIFAKKNKIPVDAFLILTDNETYYGDVYPSEALREYRDASGINAKLVVCSMEANAFSIADPEDSGMLDVVGFDTATPSVIADFIRGQI